MDPQQSRHREPRLDRVADQTVLEREGRPLHAENGGGTRRLHRSRAATGVARRFAVAEIDEQDGLPSARQLRRRAPHHHLEIVRVGAERDDVEGLSHVVRTDSALGET